MNYPGGSKYVGAWKDGRPNGQGVYTSTNGRLYVGEWRDGGYIGEYNQANCYSQERTSFSDRNTYVGEFRDGKYHGQGAMAFADDGVYVGEFKEVSVQFSLADAAWQEIVRHAREAFPEECCGVIFSRGSQHRVVRLENIQNKLHALDPQTFPQTAVVAYSHNLLELDDVIRRAEASGERLAAFYHSRPDHDAYFSAEDKAFMQSSEPIYPGTALIVASVYDRAVKIIRAFAWSETAQDFVEIPITKI